MLLILHTDLCTVYVKALEDKVLKRHVCLQTVFAFKAFFLLVEEKFASEYPTQFYHCHQMLILISKTHSV